MAKEALEAAGLWPMKEYTLIRQATIADYIANRPIHEVCTGVERMNGSSRFLWWWDQYLIREEEGEGVREGSERKVG